MLKSLYYTREITLAAMLGAAVMLLIFVVERLIWNTAESNAFVTQSIIVFILYFILLFMVFFLLINPFYDWLSRNMRVTFTAIIILAIANAVLIFGLYVDTSRTLMEVVIDNSGIFLATNASIVFFSWKKLIQKGASNE